MKFFPEFAQKFYIDLVVDKAVHLEHIARADLTVLQNPFFQQFHVSKAFPC